VGLAVWYDAADSASVTLNSGNVAELRDKSGNGRHMAQSTAANQPAYVASAQNTRSVIRSAGGNVHLRRESGGSALSESMSYLGETTHTLFVACKATPFAGQYLFWAANFTQTNAQRLILAGPWVTSGSPYYIFDSGSSTAGRLNTTVNRGSNAHIIAVRRDGSAYAAWADGTASGTATNASTTAVNFTGTFSLFAEINAAGAFQAGGFNGDLYEVVHYNRALTADERQRVERYLGAKWGITVA
jgi:hypothetical protein